MIFAGAGPEVVEERRFVEPVPSFDDLTAHHRDVCRRSAEGNQTQLEEKSGDLSEVRGQPPVDYPLVPVGGPRLQADSQHLDEHGDSQAHGR